MFELGLGIGIIAGVGIALLLIIAISVIKIASNLGGIKKEVKALRNKLEEV